jgi:predicted TIM-barrel fold metal-dependent hydrolase
MRVIDTHTHAWGPPSREHPWVNGPLVENEVAGFAVDPVYDAEGLVDDMDRVGVDEAVVVGYPICEWTDNWYTMRAASDRDRLYGVVMLDPFADDAGERLREAMAVEGVLGVRVAPICPYDRMWETFDPSVDWLLDAAEETAFWKAARETDALVQVLAHRTQLDQALEFVERYPDLTYAFDHMGHPDPATAPGDDAFARFADLAEYDGVAVKVSEVPHWSGESFPYRDLHDHVRWLLDHFGRDRVVWGSDYPNVSDVAEYAETVHWLDHVDGLSDADRTWLRDRSFREHVDAC